MSGRDFFFKGRINREWRWGTVRGKALAEVGDI